MTIAQFLKENEKKEVMTVHDWLVLRLTRTDYIMYMNAMLNSKNSLYNVAILLQESEICVCFHVKLFSGNLFCLLRKKEISLLEFI